MLDFMGLKKTINSVGEQARGLRLKIEELRQKREELNALPLPRDEVVSIAAEWGRKQQELYVKSFGSSSEFLQRPRGPGWKLHGNSLANGFFLLTDKKIGEGRAFHPPSIVGFLAVMCDEIEERQKEPGKANAPLFESVLGRLFQSVDYPETVGPDSAKRQEMIVSLDEELAKAEANYMKIRAEAEAAGIRFDRLDSIPGNQKQIGG